MKENELKLIQIELHSFSIFMSVDKRKFNLDDPYEFYTCWHNLRTKEMHCSKGQSKGEFAMMREAIHFEGTFELQFLGKL